MPELLFWPMAVLLTVGVAQTAIGLVSWSKDGVHHVVRSDKPQVAYEVMEPTDDLRHLPVEPATRRALQHVSDRSGESRIRVAFPVVETSLVEGLIKLLAEAIKQLGK